MNEMADHPVTRRTVLDKIRSIRRTINKARTRLESAGPVPNNVRHELHGHLSSAIRFCDGVKADLDAAKPRRRPRVKT